MQRSILHPLRRAAPKPRPDDWKGAGREPAVADMMDDPIVRLVMRRDGLTPDDVRRVVEAARHDLNAIRGARAT